MAAAGRRTSEEVRFGTVGPQQVRRVPFLSPRSQRPLLPYDQERHLERLLVIQSWVDVRSIGVCQIRVLEAACSACAFRDVLAGQLEMHAPEMGVLRVVNLEGLLELGKDVLKPAGLDAGAGYLRIAMHRVAAPQHGPACRADGLDHAGQ